MSQSGALSVNSGGGPVTETLTGNTGGAVGPDGSFNINILGNNMSGINVVGNPGTNTLSIVGTQATTSQRGTVTLATDAQAIAGADTSNAVTSAALSAKLGPQTAYAPICGGTAVPGALQSASTGISNSGYVLTSTRAASLPTWQVATGTGAITQIDGDSGSMTPTAGVVTISGGTTGLTTSASASTMDLTGVLVLANGGTSASLTASDGGIFYSTASAGAILAGTATARQILQSGASTTPAWSTATYPATTTVNQILYSSSANVVAGLATANQGVLTTGTGGIPVITAIAGNGELIIGSTAGAPAAATLTAGTGISITNGSNSITIAATGSEMTWTDENANFNAVVGNGYFVTATATATLPSAPSQGNQVSFAVDGTQILTITANTGQVIRIGSAVSASAGTAANNARGDSVTLVYRSSDAAWIATSVIGTWTVT